MQGSLTLPLSVSGRDPIGSVFDLCQPGGTQVLSRMTGIVSAGVDEAGLLQIRQLTMILVIESGEIRESGTHDEPLKMNGIYARMDKIQNSAQEKGI